MCTSLSSFPKQEGRENNADSSGCPQKSNKLSMKQLFLCLAYERHTLQRSGPSLLTLPCPFAAYFVLWICPWLQILFLYTTPRLNYRSKKPYSLLPCTWLPCELLHFLSFCPSASMLQDTVLALLQLPSWLCVCLLTLFFNLIIIITLSWSHFSVPVNKWHMGIFLGNKLFCI